MLIEKKSNIYVGNEELPENDSYTEEDDKELYNWEEDDEEDDGENDFDEDDEESEKSEEKENEDGDEEDEKEKITDSKVTDKKKQSREDDSYYKQMRLQKGAHDEEIRKATEAGRKKGLIDSVNGVNPYTKEKIEDNDDIEEYLNMKAMSDKGLDPITDYHKFVKEKRKEDAKKVKEQEEQNAFIEKDKIDFDKTYPKIKRTELMQDENFILFSTGRLGKESIKDIYNDYTKFISKFDAKVNEEADNKALKKIARGIATPGNIKDSGGDTSKSYYTLEEIKKMTPKQVEQNLDKINESLAKIRKEK